MRPQYTPRAIKPVADRFWSKVDKSGECWIWQGATRAGYGAFTVRRKTYRANRFVWELAHGPIPDGLMVLHNCPGGDNPLCVNPAHLFLGTNDDNMADMVRKQRNPRGANHPLNVHPDRRATGQRHGCAKLTDDDVRAIRATYQRGQASALGAQYGVSKDTINLIVQRKRWRHI